MRLIIFFLIGYVILSLIRTLLRTRVVVKHYHYNNYGNQNQQNPKKEGKITLNTSGAKKTSPDWSGNGGEYVDYEELK